MTDLFGWHHNSELPVSQQLLSGLKSRLVLDPINGATAPRLTGARSAFGIRRTMPQQAITELAEESRDAKTTLRLALELVAQEIEKQSGNPMYMAAWKKAASIVRALKPD